MLRICLRRFNKDTLTNQQQLIFPRTVEAVQKQQEEEKKVIEAVADEDDVIDDWGDSDGDKWRKAHNMPKEHGFQFKGAEPTMFGDWQHKGRTTDF